MRKFRHDISIIPPKDVRFSGKSLSEYELILALIEKVNELIKYTNSVAELVYALEKWINDEFINAIDESTKKTLIEWRESGYLQELVEDYLVNLTVATSEILDEDEQNFKSGWHPVLDTKISIDKVPKEVFDENYAPNQLLNTSFKSSVDWVETNANINSKENYVYLEVFGGSYPRVHQNINGGTDIYYLRAEYLLEDYDNFKKVELAEKSSTYFDVVDIHRDANIKIKEWTTLSGLSNDLTQFTLRVEVRDVDVVSHISWRNPMAINLTKLFGKGNEPTKEWCDENLKYYPNWNDLPEEEKPYTLMTLEKGSSDDLFLISKIQESNLQNHDSKVVLRNVGQPFIIKDSVSGKYVEVPKKQSLDPNVDGIAFNEYSLRNVFANITFSLHPDNTDDKIMVALDKSSIMHKVNLDEGFLWLISRMDKLEDDMVIFEQWVREFVTTKITELENKVNKQIDDTIEYVDEEILKNKNYVDSELVKNKNYVDQEVKETKDYVDQEVTNTKNYVDSELPKKLDKEWLKKSPNELNPVMQMLAYRGGDYVTVQGSCVIGNKIVIAYIVPSSVGTELGVLVEYDMDTGAILRTSDPMKIYHANGMDYNPKTNRIYISHANQQNPQGNNNDVSEVNYSTFTHVGVITPSNIPSGRRIKGYSYDKHTGKQYLNDDKGFYEVDSNFNVVKIIDFEPYFFRSVDGGFGLGQHVSVNNDIAYFVTTGPQSIHAFDMEGTLLKSWGIQEISQEGFWRGQEMQSMTFDTDDVAYLTSLYGITDVTTNQTIIQVQAIDFTRNRVSDVYPYTANPRTAKTLHVDPNSLHPRPDGRADRPFRDLNMAIDFARRNRLGYNTIISLADGTYGNVEVQGNGEKIRLVGASGVKENVVIRGLRCYNMDIELRNLTVKRNVKSYAYSILSQSGVLLLNGVIVDGDRDGSGTGVQSNFGTVIAHNGQGNRFLNCKQGINANGSFVLGNIPAFGLGGVEEPVVLSSTGYAPLID